MFGSDGMSGWAGYMLGQMSADSAQRRRKVVDNLLRGPTYDWESRYEALVAKAQEFLDHIKWQEGIMQERKSRIATLEEELALARSELEAQKALTRQWQEYGDKSDEGFEVLKDWSDKADGWLNRYKALYGPLPPEK